MSILKPEKIERILERFKTLENSLSSGAEGDTFVRLSKEYAELQPLARTAGEYRKSLAERAGLDEMMAAGGEIGEMAEAEKPALEAKIANLEQKLKLLLLPKDAADERNVILEVRAGTGGDEAALFAGDLFRMYQRYAAYKGWRVEIISASEGPRTSTSRSRKRILESTFIALRGPAGNR
jgi:peptide chain release factor 1